MRKYAFWVKCVTFALCVVLALCVAVSGLGVLFAGSAGMYNFSDYNAWINYMYYDIAETIASHVMMSYSGTLSEAPQWLLERTGHYAYSDEDVGSWFDLSDNEWYYIIKDAQGQTLETTYNQNVEEPLKFIFEDRSIDFPVIVGRQARELATTAPTMKRESDNIDWEQTLANEAVPIDKAYAESYPADYTVDAMQHTDSYWDPNNGDEVFVRFQQINGYTVTVGISKNYTGYRYNSGLPQGMMEWLFAARMALIAMIAISFCLFAAAFVFLMIIAGKDPETGEASPKALNKLPLDLYLAVGVCGTVMGLIAAYELLDILFYENNGYNVLVILLLCGCGIAVATLDMGFFTALAAQCKVSGGYWWRNSLCGRVLKRIWKYVRKALGYVGKGFRCIARYIREVFGMLPVIWEWIAAGGFLGIILVIICTDAHWYTIFPMTVWCLAFAAVVIYCGWCYGDIQKGIQRMKEGELNGKIDTKYMYGSFKRLAEDLNALADVAAIAAEKQLKAERMKAELITNVSHDIKTPLTSVINYVDLLQQPHTEEEGEQYLEVLSRQSARLKRLVEDLMDMSKASSGNMTVNITTVDAVETVNQALGEFADKMEAAKLIPVFRTPDSQLHMKGDGKLTWRVLSNLLSNVVKYALPGTRVYVELLRLDKSVVLSIKNISREELNITAEELTERFVRGDTSRNTEGSGLGLNIAQSLMHLQRGDMELTVDGDLFTVTLTFPTE